ncbi:MAG: hydroxyethylthiazole kinase-like uncharacterized protein yjeF [Gammaproteobacteria bacterium]|jgi:hydroxyethylthiazole kinase-like uncharacterized protein yjeF
MSTIPFENSPTIGPISCGQANVEAVPSSVIGEPLYGAAQVQALDRAAITRYHIPGAVLMERAGASAYREMLARWPSAQDVHVVCGPGNNGGDGFVVARLAALDGLNVSVHTVGALDRLSAEAKAMYAQMRTAGVTPLEVLPGFTQQAFEGAQVIVDALFGIGLTRTVSGLFRHAVDAINASPAPVIALDIPSGLHADTGARLGAAVEATLVVTYIGRKLGLLTGDGPQCCAEVVFDDLALPRALFEEVHELAQRIDQRVLTGLSPRGRGSHKGSHGHVLVVGGDVGYSGAVRLASEAALRSGSGLVSVATRASHAPYVNIGRPELMVRGVESVDAFESVYERASVVAIGPGLGTEEWGQMMLAQVLALTCPLIIDADALNLLARRPSSRDDWVLTPHPGEAGRLLGISTAQVQLDRFAAAQEIVTRYGGVCVLKGAGSIIAHAHGPPAVCTAGNPGLASAGTGDVLTGVIASFRAQGWSAYDAACLGVCAHAWAGDLAAIKGERGMLASDVIAQLRSVVNIA